MDLNKKMERFVLLIVAFLFVFQLGVDIGSSTVARGVVGLVLGYLNNLVIEMAFLIQVNQQSSAPHLKYCVFKKFLASDLIISSHD